PNRPFDPTDLTVAFDPTYYPVAIDVGAGSNGFDVVTANYFGSLEQIDYAAANTHLTVTGGNFHSPITVTDTGAGGTTLNPGDFTQVNVLGATGPLQINEGKAVNVALGNAGSLRALRGEIAIVPGASAALPLAVSLDDSADATGQTVVV